MTSSFQTTLANIKSQQSDFESASENTTGLYAVLPLLRQVGWDTDNRLEINPERMLPNGKKVDYDLQINGESRILIEVKSWGNSLNDNHETQLSNYCRIVKPKFAVLTSGQEWRLYLPPNRSRPLREFVEFDITITQNTDIENSFRRFLARDRVADVKSVNSAVSKARKLYNESQKYQKFRKSFTEAWNQLSDDNDKLAKLVLQLAELSDITTNRDNISRFLGSLDQSLVNKVSTTSKISAKKPASFDLITDNKKGALNRKIKRRNGWNNCRIEICELMQEHHPENFRENLLSMPDLFSEVGDTKLLISDSGIYVKGIWTAKLARAACYAVITKFGYPQDSLVIKDSSDTIL